MPLFKKRGVGAPALNSSRMKARQKNLGSSNPYAEDEESAPVSVTKQRLSSLKRNLSLRDAQLHADDAADLLRNYRETAGKAGLLEDIEEKAKSCGKKGPFTFQ